MNINKYIIVFLVGLLIVSSIFLVSFSIDNKRLIKENTQLEEMVALRDEAIKETDKNIKELIEQVAIADKTCNDRLKARDDLVVFINGKEDTPIHTSSITSETLIATEGFTLQKEVKDEVISKNKSDYAVDAINEYCSMFFTKSSYSEK